MIGLRVNDEFLDLMPAQWLTLRWRSPVFDASHTGRAFSYPFRVPASPRNRRILAHANRIDASAKPAQPATLFVAGLPLEHGQIELTGATQHTLELVFKNDNRALLDQLDQVKINELLPTISIPQTIEPEWQLRLLFAPGTYTITIDGIFITYTDNTGDMEQAKAGLVNAINAQFPALASHQAGTDYISLKPADGTLDITYASMNGLELILERTLSVATYENARAWFLDQLANPHPAFRTPVLYAPGLYEGKNRAWNYFANLAVGGQFHENTLQAEEIWQNTIIPFVRVDYVLQQIVAQLDGIEAIDGELWQSSDVQQLLIASNRTLDAVTLETYQGGDRYLNHFVTEFDLNDHVPDISARQLIEAILTLFAGYIEVAGNTLYLRRKSALIQPPTDLTAFAEAGYSISFAESEGYRLFFAKAENDTATVPGQLDDRIEGAGEIEIELPATLPMLSPAVKVNGSSYRIKCPYTELAATTTAMGMGETDIGLRLLFDRGMRPADTGDTYLLASHDDTDYAGNTTGTVTLDLNTAGGLFDQFWQPVARYLDAHQVERTLSAPIHVVADLASHRIATVRIFDHQGTTFGQVHVLHLKVSVQGLGPAKLTVRVPR